MRRLRWWPATGRRFRGAGPGLPHIPLIILSLAATGWLLWRGPSPRFAQDSLGYLLIAVQSDGSAWLAGIRTPGYPLILAAWLAMGLPWDLLPIFQGLLYVGAIYWLAIAMHRFGLAAGPVTLSVAPLFLLPIFLRYTGLVLSDLPAAAAGIATFALLLQVARHPRTGAWAALAAMLCASWLLRPAFLFLVGVAPLIAWWSAYRPTKAARHRILLATLLVSMAPLILYVGLRATLVGQPSVVAFTGHNLAGITGGLIRPELIASLPRDLQGLATAIEHRRRQLGLPVLAKAAGATGSRDRVLEWYRTYNRDVWAVAIPLARAEGRARGIPDDALDLYTDRRLLRLSLALIALRPGDYLTWLAAGIGVGVVRALTGDPVMRALTLACAVALLVYLWGLGRTALRGTRRPVLPAEVGRFAGAAGLYFAAGLLLVVGVEPPRFRYLWALTPLLAAALAITTLTLLRPPHAHGPPSDP